MDFHNRNYPDMAVPEAVAATGARSYADRVNDIRNGVVADDQTAPMVADTAITETASEITTRSRRITLRSVITQPRTALRRMVGGHDKQAAAARGTNVGR